MTTTVPSPHKINKRLFIPLVIIFIYLLPLLLFQEDAHLRIHDTLDSTHVWYTLLGRPGELFAPSTNPVENILGGAPRAAFPSGWYIPRLFYSFFSPLTAYIINMIIIRLVAFLGCYLLLRTYVIKKVLFGEFISIGVAITFSLLPFWYGGGLSIAGQPLLWYAFFNIRQAQKFVGTDWLIIFLFPFYSSISGIGIFLIGAFFLVLLSDWIAKKRINWLVLTTVLLLTVTYVTTNYQLFYTEFYLQPFVSHRVEFLFPPHPLLQSLRMTLGNMLFGQRHTLSIHFPIILSTVILAISLCWYRKQPLPSLFWLALGGIVILSFLLGFYYQFVFLLKGWFPMVIAFNFSRLHWFHPLLWYILFGAALSFISQTVERRGKVLVTVLIVAQLIIAFSFHDEIVFHNKPTVKEFFSSELFRQVQSFIGDPPETYRVVSIGIYPAILQYNGFSTLDGYVTYYPVEYKRKFRAIISQELEKNKEIREYFDNWGNKVYIFTDELGKEFEVTKDRQLKITNLQLNTSALYDLGGRYILSAVEIGNAPETGLSFTQKFTDETSPYEIYLYQVNVPTDYEKS